MNKGKIGIDLGLDNCCCGVFRNCRVEFIPYSDGKKLLPSYVYYNPTSPEIVVGNSAKNNHRSIGQVIFHSRRLIGKKFKDVDVQEDIKHSTIPIVEGSNGEPNYKVEFNKRTNNITAVDVECELLKRIKEMADRYMDQDCNLLTEAVITIPSYFNNQQRQYTIEAANKANLRVIKLLNEPTAAALAYTYNRIQKGDKLLDEDKLLVYNFGRSEFDVSTVKINYNNKKITVLANDGDNHLGKEDIINNLEKYYSGLYKDKTGKEINDKKLFKLRTICKKTIELLNSEGTEEAVFNWEALEDAGIDNILSRCDLNKINENIFRRAMDIVDKVLRDSGLLPTDINYILLVGDASRTPKIQEILKYKFNRSIICKNINPYEVVAYGACLYANLENMHFEVQDIVTHTISTDVEEGSETVLYPLIKKNTPIPYTSEKPICFANAEDNADYIDISVFEGEGRYPTDIGIKQLDSVPFRIPIPDAKACRYVIETRYKVDKNGILSIEVKDRQTGEIQELQISIK